MKYTTEFPKETGYYWLKRDNIVKVAEVCCLEGRTPKEDYWWAHFADTERELEPDDDIYHPQWYGPIPEPEWPEWEK